MAINFLKRKKTAKRSVLLYHNLKQFDSDRAAQKNWEKVKVRIEKLLSEISVSRECDNFNQNRSAAIEEMVNGTTSTRKQNEPSERSSSSNTRMEQNNKPEQDSSKPPLDIQEMKAIAAMAKRLSTISKIKNHP